MKRSAGRRAARPLNRPVTRIALGGRLVVAHGWSGVKMDVAAGRFGSGVPGVPDHRIPP